MKTAEEKDRELKDHRERIKKECWAVLTAGVNEAKTRSFFVEVGIQGDFALRDELMRELKKSGYSATYQPGNKQYDAVGGFSVTVPVLPDPPTCAEAK